MSGTKSGINLQQFVEELQAFINETDRGIGTNDNVKPYVESLKQIILKHVKLS